MKILQVSNRVPWPLNEGGTIGIYNYTRAYSQLGHEVTLYCLDGLKHNTPVNKAKIELEKYAQVFIHPIDTDVKAEEALKHLITNKSYNVSRFYNHLFETELETLLRSKTFDVVQLEGTFTGPYISTIRKHHKGLLALRMHNVEYEIWERLAVNTPNLLKKWYINKLASQLKSYESEILSKVDTIVPVTHTDGEKFKILNPRGNYITVPAGIDLDKWTYNPTQGLDNWYHIGSMEWQANSEAVDWFVNNVHSTLTKDFANYMLHLAGKGIDHNKYNDKNIVVHSNVPDAAEFVKKHDICVVPLKSGSGIRLKILEAMAAGKLVISTTIGAQGIEYLDGEHLLIADTPQEFLGVYASLSNGTVDYKKIVQNARQLIETKYSTESLATKQLAHYQNLLDKSRV